MTNNARLFVLLVLITGLTAGEPPLGVVATRLSTGLAKPINITHASGDDARLFVAEQDTGKIQIITLATGTIQGTFLTVGNRTSGNEEGLLGHAFHPNYASNGYVYVNVTTPNVTGGGRHTDIRRYTRSVSNPDTADPATMQVILAYDQPETNHNGGWLDFGPDGKLYIGSGDGGGGGDNHGSIGNGQNRNTLLGKIIRIDVDAAFPYAIPSDNPYVGVSGQRGELWAIGLRNPWRCDFDNDGNLWIGDVGQNAIEEISLIPAGQAGVNFGWRVWEGTNRYTGETPVTTYTAPVVDYDRTGGYCVIGGCVYRGSSMPNLAGTYFYGDYGSSRMWSLRRSSGGVLSEQAERTTELRGSGSMNNPTAFGRDASGEVYVTDYSSGEIWKFVSSLGVTGGPTLAPTTIGATPSRSLSSTGGRAPVTWSISAGTLPAGMSINGSTGVISGTPTSAGNTSFTIRATDGNGARVDRACTLLVNAAPAVTTASLPDATLGATYSTTLAGNAGTTPYLWDLASGTLATGLSLASTGTISGTPTGVTATFTVRVTDAAGVTATRSLTLTVLGGVTVTSSATIAATSVTAATTRTASATGGTTPYAWTVTAGTLPTGVTLSNAGLLSGTPTTAGTYTFTLRVQDNASASATRACTWQINPAPTITTATLPNGTIGAPYSATVLGSGGTGALSWAIAGGSGPLPGGLSLATNGTIAGTPSATGTFPVTVRTTDTVGATVTRALSITITSSPAFTSTATTTAWIGEVWSYDVDAAGSPTPTFALVTNPTGMLINTTTGVVTWTPTATGAVSVRLRASNGTAPDATQDFTLTVQSAGISSRQPTTAYLGMPTSPAGFPALLSQTGAFASVTTLAPAVTAIPYTPNHPFWSDRAIKQRWVNVPNDGAPYAAGERITWSATGSWTWPAGTVFVKHFDIPLSEVSPTPTRRLETRILVMTTGGAYGVTYRWNTAQTNADVVTTAQTEDLTITTASGTRTQRWYYPSPSDCMTCHTTPAGFVLGASTRQLNGDLTYSNGVRENQLTAWYRANLFDRNPGSPATLTALSAIGSGASLELRARSYLDANCAPCHLPGGAPAAFDARFDTPLASQNLINGAVSNNLGIAEAKVVVAGNHDRSILWQRLHSVDPSIRMPLVGRLETDTVGSQLVRDWIDSLPASGGGTGDLTITTSSGGSGCGPGLAALLLLALGCFLWGRLRR